MGRAEAVILCAVQAVCIVVGLAVGTLHPDADGISFALGAMCVVFAGMIVENWRIVRGARRLGHISRSPSPPARGRAGRAVPAASAAPGRA